MNERQNNGREVNKDRAKSKRGNALVHRSLRARVRWAIAIFFGLGLLNALAARGDQVTSPTPTSNTLPKVIAINGQLKLGEIFTVEVDRLSEWAATNDPRKLVPYLNGRELAGVYPDAIHLSHNQVMFHLERTPDSKEAWADLLRNPVLRRPVSVTMGLDNQTPFETVFDRGNPLPLTVIPGSWGVVSIAVISFCLMLFAWLAKTTNIIREPGLPSEGGKKRPYSLGRAQMAFWFFLVFTAYMAIWLILGDLDTITESLLGLMGISAGTAIGGAVIDSSKLSAKANQVQALSAEAATLRSRIAPLKAQIATLDDRLNAPEPEASAADLSNRSTLETDVLQKEIRLEQVSQEIADLSSSMSPPASVNFLADVLTDGKSHSFHRFQIFAWTIILGIIFVASVYNNLAMPQFSATLLGLMGISAGTYIGFKFPEQ